MFDAVMDDVTGGCGRRAPGRLRSFATGLPGMLAAVLSVLLCSCSTGAFDPDTAEPPAPVPPGANTSVPFPIDRGDDGDHIVDTDPVIVG